MVQGEMSTEEIMARLAAVDTMKQLIREDYDPLMLKESSLLRQMQNGLVHNSSRDFSQSIDDSLSALNDSSTNTAVPVNNHINIANVGFDARAFLSVVHGDTSYTELLRGRDNLMKASEQRLDSLKNLVKRNFDRFVNAKNSTEQVFGDMQNKKLTEGDHGMRRAMEAVSIAYQKSLDVYGGLMGRREREVALRMKLEIFNRYSFIFHLGPSLERALQFGTYEEAISKYKTSKSLMEAMKNESIKKLLNRIWSVHIEGPLNAVCLNLFTKLKKISTSDDFEIRAKLIESLIALDAKPDPVHEYFHHTTTQLITQLTDNIQRTVNEMKRVVIADIDSFSVPRIIIDLVQRRQAGKLSALEVDIVKCWKVRHEFINETFNNLLRLFMNDFINYTHGIIRGRWSSSGIGRNVQVEAINEFINRLGDQVISGLITLLSEDLMIELNVQESSAVSLHYCKKSLSHFMTFFEHVRGDLKAPLFLLNLLQKWIVKSVVILINSVWNGANDDSALLPSIETWNADHSADISISLTCKFEALMSHLLEGTGDLLKSVNNYICDPFRDLDTSLDDSLAQSIEDYITELEIHLLNKSSTNTQLQGNVVELADFISSVHSRQLSHTHCQLLLLTNLHHLQNHSIPRLFALFQDVGAGEVREQVLLRVEGKVREVLNNTLNGLLQTQRSPLIKLINSTLTTTPNSLLIRPQVMSILLYLARIQTIISDVTQSMVKVIMTELVLDLFQHYLQLIRSQSHVTVAESQCLRAELCFLQGKLITLMNEQSLQCYNQAISMINHLTDDMENVDGDDEVMLAQMIRDADSATSKAFLCFQHS